MAEMAVSFALEKLLPILTEEAKLLKGVHKGFTDIKCELESIQAFLKDADRRAAAEGDNTSTGIKIWVKQLREAAFHIEDIIDEYVIYVGQDPRLHGCEASLWKVAHLLKTLKSRHRIASEIQNVKSGVQGIKERSERYGFQIHSIFEQGSSSSQSVKLHDPRVASLFIEEAEVVGFEVPRDELVGWLVEGRTERTVISVVGMGGLGKTTLVKKVFDDQRVTKHFDCHAWISVSQSYTIEGLLRDMLEKFCKERREAPPEGIHMMNQMSLINEVRSYMQQKRYLVSFDDVWKENFWAEIESAVLDNKNGSRIIITTRSMDVAKFCKKSSFVHVYNLQPLSPEKSWELFCKRAFHFESDGYCPEELKDLSLEFVEKCMGLPLAIVAIGGLLSTKEKNTSEWQKLRQNLRSELAMNPHLASITNILSLSYDDLPYYLKSCFLYFGIYPEDCSIHSKRLVRQWIAEGFVKYEKGKTSEEVARQYMTELIHRSLVQVSKFDIEGKASRCRVHDLLHEMILKKIEDLNFCHFVEDDQSMFDGTIRRLIIATSSNDLMGSTESSHIRSLHIFRDGELPESFVKEIPTQYKLLKVLDFENAPLNFVPKNLGNLFHLRYLSLCNTNVQSLPKSVGKLQNLETLNLGQTLVRELPREINKLTKPRHLRAFRKSYEIEFHMSWDWVTGFQMKEGIGSLKSLQILYLMEADHGGIELIQELGKLRQLRVLRLNHVKKEHGSALCVSINEMHHLEVLDITAIDENEVIGLHFLSSPPQLRKLRLQGKLEKLPVRISEFQYLVQLCLLYSKLTDDPLKSLKDMPNLLYLLICDAAYEGESLHFQEGGFQKLKELRLRNLYSLKSTLIDIGALSVLQRFELGGIPQMKEVPSGIHRLTKLEELVIIDMPHEFEQSIDPDGGPAHRIIKHVPFVYIGHKVGPRYGEYDTQIIRH